MNNGFCVLPWLSIHLDSQGKRRLCCVAEPAPPEAQMLSYKEFLSSEYVKKIRSEMLSGSLPRDCQACSRSHGRKETYRTEINKRYEHHIPAIAAANLEPWKLLSVDYRSPVCNLVCKTCGPEQSTSWAKKIRATPILEEVFDSEKMKALENRQKSPRYQEEFSEILQTEDEIREIFFAGGEPLMVADHRRWLKSLVENKRAKSIRLIYNTNFFLKREILLELIEIWKSFEEVNLLISVDGAGEQLEYIRTGVSYEEFRENIAVLRAQIRGLRIHPMLQITTTSILFSQLEEMANFLWEERMPFQMHFMDFGQVIGKFLRIEFLPIQYRVQKLEQFRDIYENFSEEKKQFLLPYLNHLKRAIDLPQLSENEKRLGILQMEASHLAFGRSFREFFQESELTIILGDSSRSSFNEQPANTI